MGLPEIFRIALVDMEPAGTSFTIMHKLLSLRGLVIASILKCGMKSLTQFQFSTGRLTECLGDTIKNKNTLYSQHHGPSFSVTESKCYVWS